MRSYDVIVIGLGATGGATFRHLAQRGVRVLGIDAANPPHDGGSSHGSTRIYRQAYYEAPDYVPLARRALDLWRDLEHETQQTLFVNTGALTIGPAGGELVDGALLSARTHEIPHEIVDRDEIAHRFPAFVPPAATTALFEPTAGVLLVDQCVAAHISVGQRHGGAVHANERAIKIDADSDGVVVRTETESYSADTVVVAAGAWIPRLVGMEHAFRVTREIVHWFAPSSPHAAAEHCPVSMIQFDDGPIFYSIPDFGGGFKAGLHHAGAVTDPNGTAEVVSDASRVGEVLSRLVPGAAGPLLKSGPCYYTTTADHHFAVGPLPDNHRVIVASACSGHGFKFAPALGEHIAHLATGAAQPYRLFDVRRLIGAES